MNNKIIKILESIIIAGGNCDNSTPADCAICPLGKVRMRTNGSPMGCIESLGIDGLSIEDADKKYLDAAASYLADLRLDEILGDDDGVK